MKTLLFLATVLVALGWLLPRLKLKPARRYGSVDAIVPAYNEELCIVGSVRNLLANPYIGKVIVVAMTRNIAASDSSSQLEPIAFSASSAGTYRTAMPMNIAITIST